MSKVVRTIIDVLNIIIGVGVVVFAVMVFIDTNANRWMFPLIFALGAAMNLLTAVKNFSTEYRGRAIAHSVAAIILIGISLVTYKAIGGM